MSGSAVQLSASIISDLELWEIEEFEEKSGVALAQVVDASTLPFRAVAALCWIVKRRDDPDYSYEEARRLKLSQIVDILNPTSAPALAD